MSGQFFRINFTQREIDAVIENMKAVLSKAAHLNIGWTVASRLVLSNVEAGNPPADRAGLPPHKYLEIRSRPQAESTWLFGDEGSIFCEKLTRPANVAKGLNALGGSQAEWNLGRLKLALVTELTRANVSLEIYRIDGVEVT